jgi:hypothetical protein
MWHELTKDELGRPRYYEEGSNIVFTMDKDAVYAETVELDNGWSKLELELLADTLHVT